MTITSVGSSSVLSQGLQGMQKSSREIVGAAQEIASSGARVANGEFPDSTLDLAELLIEMKIEQNIFDASAQVVKTADEMIGALLDVTA